ncbi:MAG: tRNA uridine-5-carboxymethylaminomethyl(34) synthesis GTPase MnmE [Spirochaetaceae bacterium]|nr:tRNA uridine-5-carboxymethylaminomethyl(34) synthesis GTPase MnmE [Spirochaetaceae bacterium]
MSQFPYDKEDAICALATPWAQSAIAILRCSGPDILEKLQGVFKSSKPLDSWTPNHMGYGHIINPKTQEVLDEVMAVYFKGPKSYTGQDSVEFNCHGSLPGIEAILEVFHNRGIRRASPGEFTFRAFINGKMDLTRAEAVQEIVSARTSQAQSLALNRLSGVIFQEIEAIKDLILTLNASVALALDYPDDEVEPPPVDEKAINQAVLRIDQMLASYKRGKLFQEGVTLALAGRTNAGKSSLFNLILKEERSIVSQIHGTTRDYLESTVTLGGIPLRIFDTAGLRNSQDPVEQEGMRRTGEIVDNAQLVLLVVDAQVGFLQEEQDFYKKYKEKTILCWNKVDACDSPAPKAAIAISALNGHGFPLLEQALLDRIFKDTPPVESPVVIDSQRQKELLETARFGLLRFLEGLNQQLPMDILSEDLRESLNALGEITGEVSSSDLLELMFSRFCVGK